MMCFSMVICLVLMIMFFNILTEEREEEERIKKARRTHDTREKIINGDDDPYGDTPADFASNALGREE